MLSDKTILSRAGKIRADTYCRSQPFLVTLLLPQTKTTMGKSNHFSGQRIAEPYLLASVNFYRTAIKKMRLFYHLSADFTRHKCRRGELLYFYPQSGIISSECGIFTLDRSNPYTRSVARCYASVYHLHSAEDIIGY